MLVKATTRIFPDQLNWLHETVLRFNADFPRRKLKLEELVQLAIEELRQRDSLDVLIRDFHEKQS